MSADTTEADTSVRHQCSMPRCRRPVTEYMGIENSSLSVGWCSAEHEAHLRFLAAVGRLRDPSMNVTLFEEQVRAKTP